MNKKTTIIVLTHNRPKILKRCMTMAIKHSKATYDVNWIVLDDSCEQLTSENFLVLKEFAESGLNVIHITEFVRNNIFNTISLSTSNNHYKNIFTKSSDRDISGLRNLGLILSIILKSEFTFFIDDDMVSCEDNTKNERCFFDHVVANYQDTQNCIIGATLIGILDESYVGRLDYLIEQNKDSIFRQDSDLDNTEDKWNFKKNPLWIDHVLVTDKKPTHTSAGLIALKLDPESIIPFPSGYNEDWIWCLLQSAIYGTKIFVENVTAIHSPPSFFKPDQNGILWEQYGECLFEFLLPVIKNNANLHLKEIWGETIQKISINEKIDELDETIQILDKYIENNHKLDEQQKLNSYKSQISHTKENLEKTNVREMVDSWFDILNKRHIAFSSIINNKDLCHSIKNLIEVEQLNKW